MTASRLGDYEILNALKSGGMGDVLLARRRGPAGFEQLVAIKTVRAELAEAPLARAMFLDEARLLARLTHPGIAQILDFGEADGVAFMVMEYVPGMSFRGLAELRPPPAVLCQAVAEACRGLHAAHELRDLVDGHLLGVVHRDISPDNLMVGYDARVKVLDFGIALVRGRQAPVTELGVLKGKPPYMSPEQLRNQPLDRRSDVFSTSVVLWELVTGRPLFEGDSIYAVARAVEHQDIVAPSRIAGPLPAELDDLILAGLARDPDQRLASAAAMAEVLERIAGAGGHESLESWAERALADARERHRRWLAEVLGGKRELRAPGRATGQRTAIDGALATGETVPGVATPPRPQPGPEPVTTTEPAPRRRWGFAAILAVLLAGAGGLLAIARSHRSGGGTAGAVAIDAAAPPTEVDAAGALPPPIDAAGPPIDAAPTALPPIDAGRDRRRDAGSTAPPPVPVDAAPAPPPIDAAPAIGYLTIGHGAHSLQVEIDGRVLDDRTPVTRKVPLPAGPHRVVLRDPATLAVELQETVTITAGTTTHL